MARKFKKSVERLDAGIPRRPVSDFPPREYAEGELKAGMEVVGENTKSLGVIVGYIESSIHFGGKPCYKVKYDYCTAYQLKGRDFKVL